MKAHRLLVTVLALGVIGSMAPAQNASVILVNGKVWTENTAQPIAEAVGLAGPLSKIIDPKGRLLLPGFNDAHVHFLGGGGSLISASLGSTKSQAEFKQRIAEFARTLPKGAWLRNGNWDHQRWTPPALPNHQLIDDVCGGHPALLWRLCGHMALATARALQPRGGR